MSSRSDAPPLLKRLNALADLSRLRVLRMLEKNELSVGELARALQMPQSTISRHLKTLHEGRWIEKRSEGTASMFRLIRKELEPGAEKLWEAARGQIGNGPTIREDDSRLAAVLAERRQDSQTFFGRLGKEWTQIRASLFGDHFTAEALLSFINRDWVVADLGCGTGSGADFLAPYVKKIIAVDRESAMLEAASNRLKEFDNIEFRLGELSKLPIDEAEVDAAMIVLVMHHIDDPIPTLRDAARTLKPGGLVLIVDMVAHDRTSYRQTMGHLHQGFDEATVRGWAEVADLHDVFYRRLPPDTDAKGPGLFVATMRK